MKNKYTIVIPAYNEEKSISRELPKIIELCSKNEISLIIVNDGSIDNTKNVLNKNIGNPCITVINHKINKGYGGALKTGISSVKTEFIATMDADGQHHIEDTLNLLYTLDQSDADMVIGSREVKKLNNIYRESGKFILKMIAKILVPNNIRDLNSGLKAYRTSLIKKYIILCPNSMAFSDIITLIFINQKHLVIEHPITVKERTSGKSTISLNTAIETLLEIFNIIMLFHPMRLIFPFSVFLFICGVAWGFPIVLRGQGISVGALLAIISGIISFFFGLIAEQLSSIRNERMLFHNNEQ